MKSQWQVTDSLKKDERAWIAQRNNSTANADNLRQSYKDRIAFLEALARQPAPTGAQ